MTNLRADDRGMLMRRAIDAGLAALLAHPPVVNVKVFRTTSAQVATAQMNIRRAWWTALAPLKKHERDVVREKVAAAWPSYATRNGADIIKAVSA